ncbi:MAG: hypothetical protein ABR591_13795 [Candidatus Velthaea sp.]
MSRENIDTATPVGLDFFAPDRDRPFPAIPATHVKITTNPAEVAGAPKVYVIEHCRRHGHCKTGDADSDENITVPLYFGVWT